MVFELCKAYQSLPSPGGVLDQDVSLLRMHAILSAGGSQEQPTADPFAGIPMVSL